MGISDAYERPKRSGYRHHSIEFKRRVVEQSYAAGTSVSRVARAHDVNANQVFAWRKLFQQDRLGSAVDGDVKLLPVVLAEVPQSSRPISTQGAAPPCTGSIALDVGRAQLRIEGNIDVQALTLIMEHLLR